MSSKPPATLDLAVRQAIVDFFQTDRGEDIVTIPIGETVGSLVYFAVEIVMTIPPGPYRQNALSHLRDLVAAAEVSIASGKSVGAVLAERRGERLN